MQASIVITDQRNDYHGRAQSIELTVAGDYEAPEPCNGLPDGLLIVERIEVGGVDIYPILNCVQIERIANAACDELDKYARGVRRLVGRAA